MRVFWREGGGGGGWEGRICFRQSLGKDGAARSHVVHPVMKLDAFLINKQKIETKFSCSFQHAYTLQLLSTLLQRTASDKTASPLKLWNPSAAVSMRTAQRFKPKSIASMTSSSACAYAILPAPLTIYSYVYVYTCNIAYACTYTHAVMHTYIYNHIHS